MTEASYAKDASFWQSRFRLIQPNLRLIDAEGLDVNAMMDQVRDYGANAVLVNGGGIVAWYPTDHPYQSQNPHMEGSYLGDVIQAAHDRGIKVMVRMDVSKSFPHVYEQHPDWFRRDAGGSVMKHWEMLMTCPTGPYWEDYNFQVVAELLREYPADGLFFNAFNYLRCYCSRCRQLFREDTGFELPEQEDWSSPAWRAYVDYRYRRHADYNRRLAAHIDSISPGTALMIDTNVTTDTHRGIRESGWYTPLFAEPNGCIMSEAFNFYDRPSPRYRYWAGEEVKIGSHMKHTSIILSYSKGIFSRRSSQPAAQFGYDMMQIAAHGGSPSIAFSGAFNQDDRQAIPVIREVMRYLAAHEGEYAAMEPYAEAAIVFSQRTADYYGQEDPAGRWQSHYRGMYEILAESHIPHTVLHEGCLTPEKLRDYRCVLLPNVAALTDEEAAMIDDYVANGGHIICTCETGLYDGEGRPRKSNALRSIGRSAKDRTSSAYTYWVVRDRALLPSFGETDVLMFEGDYVVTEPADDAQPIAEDLYGVPAVRNTTPEFSYWTEVDTLPGLTVRRYGQGTCAYLPWSPDKLYHLRGVPEYKDLIAGLVRRAAGEGIVTTDAPSGVELAVAKRGQGGYLLHLLNAVGSHGKPLAETVMLAAIRISIEGAFDQAHSLVTGERLDTVRSGSRTIFIVPSLALYEAIVVR